MTKEEAIKFGKRVLSLSLFDETHEFCEIAIKALEQEPKTGHWYYDEEREATGIYAKGYEGVC